MAKVNFKKEHYDEMCTLAVAMLFENGVITTKMGQPLNIVELIHTTTINTLNNIRLGLAKQIEALESQDEWVASDVNQTKLKKLQDQKRLVNLIIGYKRYILEREENDRKREELKKQLSELKESQKTPEDRIKELEAELNSIDEEEQF